MTKARIREKGATAIIVAGALIFLFGMAALAVDTSGFYQTARVDQTTADLTCLAGVVELPENPDRALEVAHEYAQANWADFRGSTLPPGGNSVDAGNGKMIHYEVDGQDMHVTVTDTDTTTFGAVLGSRSVTIVQEASCRVTVIPPSGGVVPFFGIVGGFDGFLQQPNPCNSGPGNCRALDIPRADTNGQKEKLVRNTYPGPDRNLTAHWGSGAVWCSSVGAGGTCSIVHSDTGVSKGHLTEAILRRFENISGSTTTCIGGNGANANEVDCDSLADILGGPWKSLSALPQPHTEWHWSTELHGEYSAAQASSRHVYYDGATIAKCDSPRLVALPIATADLNWEPGRTATVPAGHQAVKIVGFLAVIITEPNTYAEFGNNWNGFSTLEGVAVWVHPDTMCEGPGGTTYPFAVGGSSSPTKSVRLVG